MVNGAEEACPTAYVSHHVPGRLRLKVPVGKGDPALLEKIAGVIRSISEVRAVDCNPLTGSLLVTYAPSAYAGFSAKLMACSNSEAGFRVQSYAPRSSNNAIGHSIVAEAIKRFFQGLDRVIGQATGNLLDLKVLLPLAAISIALVMMPRTLGTPLWVTLTLFAFTSFVALQPT